MPRKVPAQTFGGYAVADTDVLVKFTYYGDTDLNGVVNFDDYARIDGGFNSGGTAGSTATSTTTARSTSMTTR